MIGSYPLQTMRENLSGFAFFRIASTRRWRHCRFVPSDFSDAFTQICRAGNGPKTFHAAFAKKLGQTFRGRPRPRLKDAAIRRRDDDLVRDIAGPERCRRGNCETATLHPVHADGELSGPGVRPFAIDPETAKALWVRACA